MNAHRAEAQPAGMPVIAIAGGGFSGSMVAVQLALKSRGPLQVKLYDAAGGFARGVAYGTQDPAHLLNVRADRMGAFPGRPDHFYRWLMTHETQWRAAHPALSQLQVTPHTFMPRLVYGDYIAFLLQEAARNDNGVMIEAINEEVTEAQMMPQGVHLTLRNGGRQEAAALVLALGNLFAGAPAFAKTVADHPRYTGRLWSSEANSVLRRHDFSFTDEPVVMIGTGLTMIDMLLSLRARGYAGKVIAISRHGLLPQPHADNASEYRRFLPPEAAPATALGLLSAIRREVKHAAAGGHDWREVIDALRADTPALWSNLSDAGRMKLARRMLAYWNTHRHRMPPSSAQCIERETAEGSLEIRVARVDKIEDANGRLAVTMREPHGGIRTITAGHVLNCAGPGFNIKQSGIRLLDTLYAGGLIMRGPAGMGIAVSQNGRVGTAGGKSRLFALGPLLSGERLETVAAPELRVQAETVAESVLAAL